MSGHLAHSSPLAGGPVARRALCARWARPAPAETGGLPDARRLARVPARCVSWCLQSATAPPWGARAATKLRGGPLAVTAGPCAAPAGRARPSVWVWLI